MTTRIVIFAIALLCLSAASCGHLEAQAPPAPVAQTKAASPSQAELDLQAALLNERLGRLSAEYRETQWALGYIEKQRREAKTK